MNIGIIGTSASGKSTLFTAFTGTEHKGGGTPAKGTIGVVNVPDSRLLRLSALFKPKKTVHATVNFKDTIALETQAKADRVALFDSIKTCDALVVVVGAYRSSSKEETLKELEKIRFDLIINDLDFVTTRLERLEKETRVIKDKVLREKEMALLQKIQPLLEKEQFIQGIELDKQEHEIMDNVKLLTLKPTCYVLNVEESMEKSLLGEQEKEARNALETAGDRSPLFSLNASLEAEIALMEPGESASFMKEFGIEEAGRDRVIRTAYELIDLITFFTVGEDECRSWSIPKGASALEAAGAIHSDLARGFIRAEVIEQDLLLALGSLQEGKKTGKLRLEGKTYTVKDGDIVHIMFNV
jgi:ribosome-binding ATPase